MLVFVGKPPLYRTTKSRNNAYLSLDMKTYSTSGLIAWVHLSHTYPKIWVLPVLVTPHCSQILENSHVFAHRQSLRPIAIA